MKVSKERQKEIRQQLIDSAIEVFLEKGLKAATMREISKRAGIGTATIYNYFPNKEALYLGFFEERHIRLVEALEGISDFNEYSLKEKLQTQLEMILDLYLEEREFVETVYESVFQSPAKSYAQFNPVGTLYRQSVQDFLDAAVENGEIQALPFSAIAINLYSDFVVLIVKYWLSDESENFEKTSELIDLCLNLIVELLHSNMIGKTADIFSFFFKSQLHNSAKSIESLFESFSAIKNKLS
ncbi:MAG: TetR/AcrR family transcriptional regulator [Pseudomonadales bacterium]|nr:TetR/AcrR family transcriptional regulator [Pseudomonadales bacterium]